MATPFFVAVPAALREQAARLQRSESLGTFNAFELPELKVGTMEMLLALTDDLSKNDMFIEGVVKKIARQALDLAGGNTTKLQLSVEGQTLMNYVRGFTWDEQRFPAGAHPPEHVESIRRLATRIDEQLKLQFGELHEVRSKLQALTRKTTGSLISRSVPELVAPSDVINTDYLATVFVCVKVQDAGHFLGVHESLVECTNFETMEKFSAIVPQSTKKVAEDGEYALYAVYVLKKMCDDFKRECLARKFVVRDFGSAEADADAGGESREELESQIETRAQKLQQWCASNFGEVVVAWIHLKIVRLFVESVLRFGLPADFAAMLVEPKAKQEKKIRALLKSTFVSLSVANLDGGADEGAGADGEFFYPYVSVDVPFDILK
eukprot:Amastigsp_a508531_1707.p2 type:complete len:379 gc:universal Amastigsp_a508531_1707:1196-60(-)